MERRRGGIGKFLAGAAIGVGLGVLFAPKSGKETRKELKDKLDEMIQKVKDIDIKEVRESFTNKIEEIKKELADLDKEKAVALAKEKAASIKKKLDELVKEAKEKATPVIQKTVDELRKKTIVVLENTIDKLEKADKKAEAEIKPKKTASKTTKKTA